LNFEYQIAKDAHCSPEERKECIGIIDKLCDYSEKARREGLLSLEDVAKETEIPFLKKGIELVIEGSDPVVLEQIFQNYLKFSHLQGKELLYHCIIAEGLLSIQAGDNVRILREKIKPLLGGIQLQDEKELSIQHELDDLFEREDREKMNAVLEKLQNKEPFSKNTQILDSFFPLLSEMEISRLLVEVEHETLAIALCGASGLVISKILKIYPVQWGIYLLDAMEDAKRFSENDMISCQKKIENIYIKLREIENL
jgi:hypothetical protein